MKPLRAGPFRSVRDAPDPLSASPKHLLAARNMLFPDPRNGAAIVQRSGYAGAPTALAGKGQSVFAHRRLDGSLDRYVFAGGTMYAWDGGTTYTDITPVGITIHATNPIFVTAFFDDLVITDGANQPWVYDPDTATATLIQAFEDSRPWTAQGPIVVYSAKLVAIVKRFGVGLTEGAQNTIVWSEEGYPLVGYQQAQYDNLWELVQTSSETLTCLVSEEGALIYFRTSGISYITGSIGRDFRTAATRDSISTTLGTNCPAAVTSINGVITFPDLDGRLHQMTAGGGPPTPIWKPMRAAVREKRRTLGRAALEANARAGYHEAANVLLVTLWESETAYCFDAESLEYLGTWALNATEGATGEQWHAFGSMVDADELETFVILGTRGAGTVTGIAWREKPADDARPWVDTPNSSVATHTLFERMSEMPLAAEPTQGIIVDTVRAQIVDPTAGQQFALRYLTSGASAASDALTATVVGASDAVDVGHVTWGLGDDAQGAAIRLRISAVGEPSSEWGLQQLVAQVRPVALDADPY